MVSTFPLKYFHLEDVPFRVAGSIHVAALSLPIGPWRKMLIRCSPERNGSIDFHGLGACVPSGQQNSMSVSFAAGTVLLWERVLLGVLKSWLSVAGSAAVALPVPRGRHEPGR